MCIHLLHMPTLRWIVHFLQVSLDCLHAHGFIPLCCSHRPLQYAQTDSYLDDLIREENAYTQQHGLPHKDHECDTAGCHKQVPVHLTGIGDGQPLGPQQLTAIKALVLDGNEDLVVHCCSVRGCQEPPVAWNKRFCAIHQQLEQQCACCLNASMVVQANLPPTYCANLAQAGSKFCNIHQGVAREYAEHGLKYRRTSARDAGRARGRRDSTVMMQ